MSYISSWSGGKDSCFACYRAICEGYRVSHLINFVSKEYKRVSFHGTEARLIQLQSRGLGIPLLQKETTWDGYEQEFKEAVRSLLHNGIEGLVFGDIYLLEHRDWVERVCGELGIEAIEPLWGRGREELLADFLEAGFEAVVVSAQCEFIDQEWIGRRVDRSFVEYLKGRGVDVCGENGEYHTLVTDGPMFKRRLEIIESRTIRRDSYWFLDIGKYRLGQPTGAGERPWSR